MMCDDCRFDIFESLAACPHCGRPSLFPNVYAISASTERSALLAAHEQALRLAREANLADSAMQLERLASASQAIIARSAEEAMRLATADDQAYASYYELLHAGVRLPSGEQWDRLRGLADVELFGSYRDKIRFAALSADGSWLTHYGSVAFFLSEAMIAHRTTIFVENSALYFKKQRQLGNEPPVLAGSRALWEDRGKLALVKHAAELTVDADAEMCSRILFRAGETSVADVFLEAHIYGSLTRRSFTKVVVKSTTSTSRGILIELSKKLRDTGAIVEGLP